LGTSCMPVPECRRQYYRPTGAALAREHPLGSYGVAAWSAVQATRDSLQLPPPVPTPATPLTALLTACRPTPLSSAASPFVPTMAAPAAAPAATPRSAGQPQPPAGRHRGTRQRQHTSGASVPETFVLLERCIGSWRSPETTFRVQRKTHKGITSSPCFEQRLPDGRTARSILQLQGQWMQGKVLVDHSEHSGTIRLRPGQDPTTLIFSRGLRSSTGDEQWGPCVEATRCADDRLREVVMTSPALRLQDLFGGSLVAGRKRSPGSR